VHLYHSKIVQIPLTNPYPGPRSVLILDNCNIHHSEGVRQLVEDEAGISKLYLSLFQVLLNLFIRVQDVNSFFSRHTLLT
jgi:hypothetical protein